MRVFVKNISRRKNQFQFYMQQFAQSLEAAGMPALADYRQKEKAKRLVWQCRELARKWRLLPRARRAVVVPAQAYKLLEQAYPYYFDSEIVPMLWDCWPQYHEKLYDSISRLGCKLVFVTSSVMAQAISQRLGIEAVWIPEGLDTEGYSKGLPLAARPNDVYELGRLHAAYDAAMDRALASGAIRNLCRNEYNADGSLVRLAFPDAESLRLGLSTFKVVVSFPQTDTHPGRAGNIETLTQRYWEAMLSGCLIVGRAPKELIDFIGYDPVVNVDWDDPVGQMRRIMDRIGEYQPLVDKNVETALRLAPWSARTEKVFDVLRQHGYEI